jgi:hypothetical protein
MIQPRMYRSARATKLPETVWMEEWQTEEGDKSRTAP